jgi:hypothetical protein
MKRCLFLLALAFIALVRPLHAQDYQDDDDDGGYQIAQPYQDSDCGDYEICDDPEGDYERYLDAIDDISEIDADYLNSNGLVKHVGAMDEAVHYVREYENYYDVPDDDRWHQELPDQTEFTR